MISRRLRRLHGCVAAGLVVALVWSQPTVPIHSTASVANSPIDIVCSGTGFGPSHGGIWLSRKTVQAQTETNFLDAQTERTCHHPYSFLLTSRMFRYSNPAHNLTTELVHRLHIDPIGTIQNRAPPA